MAMNTLSVTYATPVQKQELTAAAAAPTPQVVIPPSNTVHTLIMFDPDSAQPAYIHWMITDIPASGSVAEGNIIFNYTPPTPTPGTGIDIPGRGKGHRYYFALFNGSIPDDKIPQARGKFTIKAFQEEVGLQWTAWNGFWVIT
jgi:phosphatidylethanolamine-binding protein (PEBP) family uncharacterized protein